MAAVPVFPLPDINGATLVVGCDVFQVRNML
jgi:hypothetical protein